MPRTVRPRRAPPRDRRGCGAAADEALADGDLSLQKACFDYHILGPDKVRQQQLEDHMISGLGLTLHHNRMDISGFPQWYPFGVGERYQKQDETTSFRFVLEER